MKTKILVLIGIAICAILLTSPALASAGYSMIYGNANEDDILDMRDVTYIKLVIFGKKPATTLADANYDEKISMLDVGQTKLIILGKEKKLTLVDCADRTVTINKPVERVVPTDSTDSVRTVVQLGAAYKLVAITSIVERYVYGEDTPYWFALSQVAPELKELPSVGSSSDPNRELIVSLKPDMIFASGGNADVANSLQANTGIPVVCIRASGRLDFEMHRLVGTVIGKEKEAEELISYLKERHDKVTEVTSQIPDSEKPKVYFSKRHITSTPPRYDPIDLAGGINVAGEFADIGNGFGLIEVSKEQIIVWNPDIILKNTGNDKPGTTIEDILSDPVLQTVTAVKERKVYYTRAYMIGWDPVTGVTQSKKATRYSREFMEQMVFIRR
jgi:iron complex transport system substrate-binding protein